MHSKKAVDMPLYEIMLYMHLQYIYCYCFSGMCTMCPIAELVHLHPSNSIIPASIPLAKFNSSILFHFKSAERYFVCVFTKNQHKICVAADFQPAKGVSYCICR